MSGGAEGVKLFVWRSWVKRSSVPITEFDGVVVAVVQWRVSAEFQWQFGWMLKGLKGSE